MQLTSIELYMEMDCNEVISKFNTELICIEVYVLFALKRNGAIAPSFENRRHEIFEFEFSKF